MKLSELKNSIINNTLNSSWLLFVYEDNDFLVNQYIHEISKINQLEILYVESLEELNKLSVNDDAFSEEPQNIMRVLRLEELTFPYESIDVRGDNFIITCSKIDKKVIDSYSNYKEENMVDFPKLEAWQVKDYIKVQCNGLKEDDIDYLYSVTGGNIFRIENEINKIKCFNSQEQRDLLYNMVNEGAFGDLSQLTIYNLTNAIIKRNYIEVKRILKEIKNMDVEPLGLCTILHKNIKNLIDVQMDSKASAQSLNMSDKQFKAIKYNCGKFSNEELINLLKFLNEIDFKLKSGQLDISNENKNDYIICKFLE